MANNHEPHTNGVHVNGHELAPTDPGEWMQPYAGVVKELPRCGLRVRLRPVDLLTLAMEGTIPDQLTPTVADMIFNFSDAPGEDYDEIERMFRIKRDRVPVLNAICKAAFLEPAIVDDPETERGITIDTIPITDRIQVLNMVTQGVDHLKSFPAQPGPHVEAVPDIDETEPAAEPVGDDS